MDTYHLNLSFTEFDTLKATMIISIRNLEKIQTGLQDLLDHPLPPEQYNLYLALRVFYGYLSSQFVFYRI
jgi:hypothetical protein